MQRRQFFEVAGKGALGSAVAFATAHSSELYLLGAAGAAATMAGCTAMDELQTWVPIAISAFGQIVSFINPVAGSAISVALTTVQSLWDAVSQAIFNYQHTTDPTATLLDKVIATLDAVQSGLAGVLASLPVSILAAILAATKLGFGLLLATLKRIQAKIEPTPAPVVAAARNSTQVKVAAALASITPTPVPAKDNKDFVNKWNAIMTQNGLPARLK